MVSCVQRAHHRVGVFCSIHSQIGRFVSVRVERRCEGAREDLKWEGAYCECTERKGAQRECIEWKGAQRECIERKGVGEVIERGRRHHRHRLERRERSND